MTKSGINVNLGATHKRLWEQSKATELENGENVIQKKQKIHRRKIDITTYEGDSDSVIVEGILKDDWLFESYRLGGERIPPGTIHHMIVRLKVKGPQLVIEDIEVEMPTVPHEVCSQTLGCLEPIKGTPIISGFTRKLKALAGGHKGCIHLVTLLTAMAPAAVQGAFSAKAREPIDQNAGVQNTLKKFMNTCWVWREDGPLVKMYKDFFKSKKSPERRCQRLSENAQKPPV